jgi:hypothetical protein
MDGRIEIYMEMSQFQKSRFSEVLKRASLLFLLKFSKISNFLREISVFADKAPFAFS